MRMIGIGLTGFLLAGVALLLSTMNVLEQGERLVRKIASGPHLVFEHQLAVTAQDEDTVAILSSGQDHPVILSGFPAYQSVAFTLPKDARPTSGYLQINATSQVLAGVEGVLRISITGTRRAEMLLRPGEAGRSLQIPLSPAEFAGDQLVVSLSLQGTDPRQHCGQEDSIAAIVEIETTTALHLTLDRPLTSARDRVHAWGDVVRVSWPAWLKPDEQMRRLVLGAKAKQHGFSTQFLAAGAEDALTTVALREVLETVPKADNQSPDEAIQLAQGGAYLGLRRFYRSAEWRMRYMLSDGADQHVPSHIDLRMAFGDLFGGHDWSLTVTLNNRLVLQDSFEGRRLDYRERVNLPVDWQKESNQIEVVAATTAPRDGICDQGPELVAEMLQDTRLVAGPDVYRGPVAELRETLGTTAPLNVALATSLTTLRAELVANWLAQIVPPSTMLKPARRIAQIVVADADIAPSFLPETGPVWILGQGSEPATIHLRPALSSQDLPSSGVILLIAPDGIEVAGGAS